MSDEILKETASPTAEEARTSDPAATEDGSSRLQSDLDRFRDLAMRSQADFDNFRKRAAREKEDAIKYANSSFLERLIPIFDNLELGLGAAKKDVKDSPILLGLEMVAKQLNDFLTECGATPIEATGQKFDPNLHEALSQEESADIPEGHVARQLRRGFKLKERLLRPAHVIVSKGKPAA